MNIQIRAFFPLYKSSWPSRLGHHFRIYTLTLLKCRFHLWRAFVLKVLCVLYIVFLASVVLTILQENLKGHLCESFRRSLYCESLFGMISARTRSWREFKVLSHFGSVIRKCQIQRLRQIKEGVFKFCISQLEFVFLIIII